MARKKSTKSGGTTTELTPAVGKALVPILGSERALDKMAGTGGSVTRERGVTLVTGRPYAAGDRVIPASEIFFVNDAKPDDEGPWLGEADKLSWLDEETGFECIMLRETGRGYLSGYVGVPRGHPLWGWEAKAVSTDLGIEVHGGLTYARICDEGPTPTPSIVAQARRICHVPRSPIRYAPITHATDHRAQDEHVWWFGFDCDHVYDVVPGDSRRGKRFLAAETGAVYRDDEYVVREIGNLARQLRAIADGGDMPERKGPPLPPIGLDDERGG